MDARQLLTEFAHIASAPGGVQRLRELILSLAISGDLVPNYNPEDAHILLASIRRRKKAYRDQRKVVPRQPEPDLGDFRTPSNWAHCRLGDLVLTITGGGTPSKANPAYWGGDIPWATVKDLQDHKFLEHTHDRITAKGLQESSSNLIPPGRVIVCTRMGLGKVAINTIPLAINQDLKALELPSEVEAEYFRILYQTRNVTGKGTTVEGIRQSELLALHAVLPPREEQKQIVAKVSELMVLCDKLEGQQQQREKLCTMTRNATFGTLGAAKTARELTVAWRRATSNAPLLLDSPESVQGYRGTILDLAMSGAFLPASEYSSSSGRDLLRKIDARRVAWAKSAEGQELKEALAMQEKVRTQRRVEVVLPIPRHWEWASILGISQAVVDCHNKTAPYMSHGIHLVRTTDIRKGRMDLMHTRKVSADTYAFWARRLPPKPGDVVFTREAPMGEAAVVPPGEQVCLGQRTMLIRLFPDLFNNKFLLYAIYSPSFQARLVEAAIGMTVKHLRVGDVESLLVPVPPKEEQDRIVAIIDRFFAECDHLEEAIARRLQVASDLARAVTEAITGIQVGNRETMKTPKTELVSPLRVGSEPSTKDEAPLAVILLKSKGELSAKALWSSSGLEIDLFYQQLKTEMSRGWIVQPEPAYVKEVEVS